MLILSKRWAALISVTYSGLGNFAPTYAQIRQQNIVFHFLDRKREVFSANKMKHAGDCRVTERRMEFVQIESPESGSTDTLG